jgi:2-polyprenyl-6-methoxyphenol hydroxylase-like FAD-dependent oxidoreductase
MILGLLLARAGIPVLVLEKHADFLRDFRGDTIHPSTLEIIYELGLLPEFLRRPHQETRTLGAQIGDDVVEVADFTHLPTHCRFLALMPQWDFLDFVAAQARRYPTFQLRMEAEVTGLIEEDGRVIGVRAKTPDGGLTARADLVVGADGRHSAVRELAGLEVDDLGAPMDVLWMRLSRRPDDPPQTLGRVDAGRILVMLNRKDYWQCAFVIAKGGYAEIQARGLPAFREVIARLAPYLRDRIGELRMWDDVKLLSVAVDRLRVWHRPGCCASATRLMRPRRSAGSGSTWRSRMRSRRRISSRARCWRVASAATTCAPSSAGARSPPERRRDCRYFCRTGLSAPFLPTAVGSGRRCCCASSAVGVTDGACPRELSASAFAPST